MVFNQVKGFFQSSSLSNIQRTSNPVLTTGNDEGTFCGLCSIALALVYNWGVHQFFFGNLLSSYPIVNEMCRVKSPSCGWK